MRRVADGLWLGDVQDAGRPDELRARGVTRIVSLIDAELDEPYPETVRVTRHPLTDGQAAEWAPFAAATDTVRGALDADESVLCHCSAGISRSGAVVAAALAVRHDESFDAGLERVVAAKPNVNPHPALRALGERYVAERDSNRPNA